MAYPEYHLKNLENVKIDALDLLVLLYFYLYYCITNNIMRNSNCTDFFFFILIKFSFWNSNCTDFVLFYIRFDFLLCDIKIILTLSFCYIRFDFYYIDFICHMSC